MFSLAAGCWQWLTSKDELKILIVGLDYAGKTSLLEQIKRAYISHYGGGPLEGLPPTIGMNLARVATQRVDVTFWDVGGSMHAIWDRYYSDADGLVFVIDATDRGRFERVKNTLFAVLAHPALADIPLLVLANKSDVPGSAATTEVHDRICRVEGSPLGGGGGGGGGGAPSSSPSSSLLTSGGAVAPTGGVLGGGSSGGSGGLGAASHGDGDASTSSSAAAAGGGKREYRVFTCSAHTAEGVREACDWIIGHAKRHMYARIREEER